MDELASSEAPIGLLYERLKRPPPQSIILIVLLATLNGFAIQIIMASRMLYGMSSKGQLAAVLGHISPHTGSPLRESIGLLAVILILVLFFRWANSSVAFSG